MKFISFHQRDSVNTGRASLIPFFLSFALEAATAARGGSSPKSTYGEPERPSNLEKGRNRNQARTLCKDVAQRLT